MAKKLEIRDANGNRVSTLPAERYAFLRWRKAFSKRFRFPARNVAIVIAVEKPPATMLVDTGKILHGLDPWIAEGETKCELVVRVPDRADFAEHEVWQPWAATAKVK